MNNKEIGKAVELLADLKELHGEDIFRVSSVRNAGRKLSKFPEMLSELTLNELQELKGVGKSVAKSILEINTSGYIEELEKLKNLTPPDIIRLLNISGLGPKKIEIIWKSLGIESIPELRYACNENRLLEAKGFGKKTQDEILKKLDFLEGNEGFYLFSKLETIGQLIIEALKKLSAFSGFDLVGDIRRNMEISSEVEILISFKKEILEKNKKEIILSWKNKLLKETELSFKNNFELEAGYFDSKRLIISPNDPIPLSKFLHKIDFTLITYTETGIPINLYFCEEKNYIYNLFLLTGSKNYLNDLKGSFSLIKPDKNYISELEIYTDLNLPYLEPELREDWNQILVENQESISFKSLYPKQRIGKSGDLVNLQDLKGALHNHTTYSDGIHSLEDMVKGSISLGLTYIGICDHSKTAVYAKGLSVERVKEQWKEIEALNLKYAPFKIFKGIESDILNDGNLDYLEDVLIGFDFIVASVHSNLKMDINKATKRLLKAIENPYTTILGHPSGRLLLGRAGYPLDMPSIIEACIENQVVIEINANPNRLDLDWRWINYGLDKGVLFSINPDAHKIEGLKDMRYGVLVARKAGLSAEKCLNTFEVNRLHQYFLNIKNKIKTF